MNTSYIYLFLDPRKPGRYCYRDFSLMFEPFYVGKGTGRRALTHFQKASLERDGNRLKSNKILKIINETFREPFILKARINLSEEEAFAYEVFYIQEIGRIVTSTGPLTNMREGGVGHQNDSIGESLSRFYLSRNEGVSIPELETSLISLVYEKPRSFNKKHFSSHGIAIEKDEKKSMSHDRKAHWNPQGELNPMYGVDRSGTKSPTAKYCYVLVDPNGKQHFVDYGCLKIFCSGIGIGDWSMRHSAEQFEQTGTPYIAIKGRNKGWSAFRFEHPSDNPLRCNNGQSAAKLEIISQEGSTTISQESRV